MDRDSKYSLNLLKEYNKERFHLQHAITVDEVLRFFAAKNNEDEEFWGNVGLLHDLDFEMYPEEHCAKTGEILKEHGYSEEFIRAVKSHGYGIVSEEEPQSEMEKVLFAIDELTGLIGAAALMKPSKSFQDMENKSVKKKFKDKKFAAGCSRDIILQGAERLNWTIDELIANTLEALKEKESNIDHRLEEAVTI